MGEPERIEVHAREGRPADGQPIGTYVESGPSSIVYTSSTGHSWQPPARLPWGGGAGASSQVSPRMSGGIPGSPRIESQHLGYSSGDGIAQLASHVENLQASLQSQGFASPEQDERVYDGRAVIAGQQAAVLTPGQAARARILATGPKRRSWVSRAYWMGPAIGLAVLSLIPPDRIGTPVLLVLAAVAAWVRQDWHWRAYRKACGCWACCASWWRHPLLRAWLLAGWVTPPKRHGHPPRTSAWWQELHDLEKDLGIEPLHDEAGNLPGDEDVEVA